MNPDAAESLMPSSPRPISPVNPPMSPPLSSPRPRRSRLSLYRPVGGTERSARQRMAWTVGILLALLATTVGIFVL